MNGGRRGEAEIEVADDVPAPSIALSETLGATVRVGTVRVGEVGAVLLDSGRSRAIGFEVSGTGGVKRFLPWVAARIAPGVVSVESALLLVDDGESYERLGAMPVREGKELDGLLAGPDGSIARAATVSPRLAAGRQR